VILSILRFTRSEAGATAMEYGMILGLIGVAIVVSIGLFYTNLGTVFEAWSEWFGSRAGTVPSG
jgi:Flp pilus assembly pilin Flp